MIDYLVIALTHGLLALAAWRLLQRSDLDSEAGLDAKPADAARAQPLKKPRPRV